MDSILNALKWVAGIALGLILVVGLCWWLIPDEPLDPGVEKLIALAAPPPAASNAFFMIWGFTASPELDPHAVGQKIAAAHDALLAGGKGLAGFTPDAFYGDRPLRLTKDFSRLCAADKENCLNVYQAKSAEIKAQSDEYELYLARYRKIRDYKDFGLGITHSNFQTPIPSWQPIIRMSELVDGSIAQRVAAKGTQKAALEELAAEINSWRRLLQGNDWLITQMISVATLHRKYRLASEIMNAYPDLVVTFPELMAAIAAPLSLAESNILRSMGAEARSMFTEIQTLHSTGKFATDTFFVGLPGPPLRGAFYLGGFRPNATINLAYSVFKDSADLFAKSPKVLLAGNDAAVERQKKMSALSINALFFNPVGRIASAAAFPDYSNYAFRIYDLVGLTRLIDLQRRIVEGKVPLDKIGVMLSSAGPGLMDPYSEQPMQWDASNRQISFVLHGKRFANYGYVTLEQFK